MPGFGHGYRHTRGLGSILIWLLGLIWRGLGWTVDLAGRAFRLGAKRQRQLRDGRDAIYLWEEVARERGLRYERFDERCGRLRGMLGPCELRIEPEIQASGDPDDIVIHIRLQVRMPLSFLELHPETALARGRKLLGSQDIILGDEAFDDAFLVQGQPEARVRATLSPGVRRELLRLRVMLPSLRFQRSTLEASDRGVMSNGRLRRLLVHLEAAGTALHEAAQPSLQ